MRFTRKFCKSVGSACVGKELTGRMQAAVSIEDTKSGFQVKQFFLRCKRL